MDDLNNSMSAESRLQGYRTRFQAFNGDCAAHGPYSLQTWGARAAECPTCRASRQEAEERQLREQQERRRHERALDAAGIVGRNRAATFATFEARLPAQRVVVQACKDFADAFAPDQGDGLWLLGPPGAGKTHLGCAIAQALIAQRRHAAIVMTAREVVRSIRDSWGNRGRGDSESDVIDRLGYVDCLVLDDLGVGSGTDAEIAHLFDVVDLRYRLRRPTVVLSNLTDPQLKANLGDRLYERLREGSTVVPCAWPSYRAKGAFISGGDGKDSA